MAVSFVIVFAVALGASLLVTPWIRGLALRWRIGDYPDKRKVHKTFVPRMGGVGIIVGVMAGLAAAVLLHPQHFAAPGINLPLISIAFAIVIGLGVYDDVRGVGSLGKLVFQTLAGLCVMWSGLRMTSFALPLMAPVQLGIGGPLLTLLWLIGVTNAVNLLDGLDGLAAGVAALVASAFLAMGVYVQDWIVVGTSVALIAGCLGFLRSNFHPASVFMGDTGSLFLGFLLACLSLRIAQTPVGTEFPISLLAVIVALAVPIVDTSVAFFRRIRRGMHPLKPDKEHIHHRIMDLGLTHRQTVVTIYAVSAFNALVSLLLVYLDSMYAAVLLAVMVVAVFTGIRRLGYIEELRVQRGGTLQAMQPLSVARIIDRSVLILGDFGALALAFIFTYWFRFDSGAVAQAGYVTLETFVTSPAVLMLSLGWLALYALAGLYEIPWDASRIDYAFQIVRTAAIGTLVLSLLTLDIESMTVEGRLTTLFYGLAVAILTVAVRMVIIAFERRHEILGFRRRNTILVGTSAAAGDLLDDIARRPGLKYSLVGVIDRKPVEGFRGLPFLGIYSDIPAMVKQHKVEEILIATNYVSREEILDILAQCNGMVPDIKVVPESLDVLGGFKFEEVVGHPLIRLHPTNMRRWQWIAKRLVDIVVALLVLLPLLPAWVLVALIIRLDSPGPTFFVQERIGKKGKAFNLVKFRSMIPDAERDTGPVWAQPDDVRVTRLGKMLRKLRIDEVPQFINVLRGEMSLVGPRPERSFFVEQLKNEVSFYTRRLLVRPGITGWAQVRHRYDRSLEDVVEKIRYDLYYLENMSLTLDFKIILRTIVVALSGKGTH